MRLTSILGVTVIVIAAAAMLDCSTAEAQVIFNKQSCTMQRITSSYGTEIESKSGGYVSIPLCDQDGAEIGRKVFLESPGLFNALYH